MPASSHPQVLPQARTRGRPAGFTLIELMVVTLLIGLGLGLVLVRLDSLVPGSRLDKAARDLGAILIKVRDMAVFTSRPHYVEYDIDRYEYRIRRYATFAEQQDGAGEYVESDWFDLPDGIQIEHVYLPGGEERRGGRVTLTFYPTGEVEGHLVNLLSMDISDSRRARCAVELNPVTGLVSYIPGGKDRAPVRDEYEFRR